MSELVADLVYFDRHALDLRRRVAHSASQERRNGVLRSENIAPVEQEADKVLELFPANFDLLPDLLTLVSRRMMSSLGTHPAGRLTNFLHAIKNEFLHLACYGAYEYPHLACTIRR
jgi:hypothetical protein